MANKDDESLEVAKPNEIGIFINDENEYRIMVPKAWQASKEMPRFPYLVVAAIMRMSENSEEAQAFARELFVWAEANASKLAKNKDTSKHQVDLSSMNVNTTRH